MGTDRSAYNGTKPKNRQGERDAKREARRAERQARQAADVREIDPAMLINALRAATAIEGALRIGLSRDGGAFAIGVYGDGEPYTEYVGASEDINAYFSDLAGYLDGLAD